MNVILLSAWSIFDPLRWVREPILFDEYGRSIESFGFCTADHAVGFATGLLVVNIGVLALTSFQSYNARNIATEFSESEYIAKAVGIVVVVSFMAIPVYQVSRENTQSRFLAMSCSIFAISLSLLLLVFLPKMFYRGNGVKAGIRRSLQARPSDYDEDKSENQTRSFDEDLEDSEDSIGVMRVTAHPKLYKQLEERLKMTKTENTNLKKFIRQIRESQDSPKSCDASSDAPKGFETAQTISLTSSQASPERSQPVPAARAADPRRATNLTTTAPHRRKDETMSWAKHESGPDAVILQRLNIEDPIKASMDVHSIQGDVSDHAEKKAKVQTGFATDVADRNIQDDLKESYVRHENKQVIGTGIDSHEDDSGSVWNRHGDQATKQAAARGNIDRGMVVITKEASNCRTASKSECQMEDSINTLSEHDCMAAALTDAQDEVHAESQNPGSRDTQDHQTANKQRKWPVDESSSSASILNLGHYDVSSCRTIWPDDEPASASKKKSQDDLESCPSVVASNTTTPSTGSSETTRGAQNSDTSHSDRGTIVPCPNEIGFDGHCSSLTEVSADGYLPRLSRLSNANSKAPLVQE